MPESKRYNTGEVELSYSEWPGYSPPILALHGISGTRSLQFLDNRGRQRGFAYDHRGHGDSGRTPGAYTFVNYGRDCVAFLRGVVKEPALLIGHSLGGMTALYAAAHAPELVRAAFLIDPPLYAPEGPLRDERQPLTSMIDMAVNRGRLVAEGCRRCARRWCRLDRVSCNDRGPTLPAGTRTPS
jgi:pimeloyl-ACP methyl ester carboxylesterase